MNNAHFPVFANLVAGLTALAILGCSSSDGGGAASGGQGSGGKGSAGALGNSGNAGNSLGNGGASGGAPSSGAGQGGSGVAGTPGAGGSNASGGAPTAGASSGGTAAAGATGVGGGTSGASGAGGATTACPATTLKVGDNNSSVMSGGESRTFIVRIPTGYTGTSPVPVVIDFHPLGGTGSSQESSSGWKAKCDSVGCIAVFPDSSASKGANAWNAGYCCNEAQKNKVDDVQFARDIIKYLQANTCADPKRIYASGGSNGGGMTYRMACEAADVIAAVAPVDFRCVTGTDPLASAGSVTAANNTACSCKLPRPLSVIAWDEKADTSIVPYAGGQTPNLKTDCPPTGSCVGIGFPSAEVNAATWASFNKCTDSGATDPNNSLCKTWSSCQGGTQVSLCSTTSGGHLAVYSNASAKFTDTAWNGLKTQALP